MNTANTEKGKSLWYYSYRRFRRHKLATGASVFMFVLIIVSLLAPLISPYNPDRQLLEFTSKPSMFESLAITKTESGNEKVLPVKKLIKEDSENITYIDYTDKEKTESKQDLVKHGADFVYKMKFLLGTDKFGRDILSRLIYGARISLSVGLISQSIALLIGILLGSLAGYYRGITDRVIMWLVNVVWAFPSILLVIAISIVLGKGYWQAFVAIGLTGWVDIARVMRGQIISIRETEYVEAARAAGYGNARIIMKHVIPNSLSPVIITSTVGLANAIIFESSLSFLGLGVQPPTASWGQMVFDGYKFLITGTNFGMVLYPSLAILLTVFAVNLIGDGIRDAFDPKLKR
ncbi:MAG: ABC transporter permease [Ignavibacteria bacterium]|nr:ABC transporter permease [Ignavibacteria bacterium]